MGDFTSRSMWMKCAWILITIGFAVWLAASGVYSSFDAARVNAFDAFLIIGVITYYGSVMCTYLWMFVPDTAGNNIVLIVDIILAFIAGISAIIVLAIGQLVNLSDRMAYSAICAIVTGVFCVLELVGVARNRGGAGGAGGGVGSSGVGGGGVGAGGDFGGPTYT